ncbi:hypothetical protein LM602_01845 [Candidatus Acetothermia bacterium]|nr:hypothetical protein [Candidatus Acetothermia bacterium]MCI2431287.1 hypothetical protein [Candidatus Acetothermia bacterium]MCI2436256.1 hypothetical protein [Candidatus Acetothermia bacterium]
MRKHTLVVLFAALLCVGGVGLAQADDDQAIHEALKKLLLSGDEISELLGGAWLLDQTGRLKFETERDLGNAVSAFGIYLKRGRTRDDIIRLITALWQHRSEQDAKELFERGLAGLIPVFPESPVALPAEQVKPVQEALKGVADEVQFFKYEGRDETLGLAFRKGARAGILRVKLATDELLSLARKQIEVLSKGRP